MTERLSDEEVRHVADLARLAISDDEVHLYRGQLNDILGHVDEMESLNLDDVPPTTHALPLVNVLREDVVVPSLSNEDALSGAPAKEGGQFRVPKILGEEP